MKNFRDISISIFCIFAAAHIGVLNKGRSKNFTLKGMNYSHHRGNLINLTKDSLECEFYRQYLEPVKH